MISHHATEFDSLNSTPRSSDHDEPPPVRFMCSFGGKILPRPHDDQLRYVGGDTRIVTINRHATFSSLLDKLSRFAGTTNISMKYQLPNEDLDALITITNDEDVENMMEEYERLAQNHTPRSKSARLRLFLFPHDADSRASSISSLLNGSTKREHWFFDALNGGLGPGLERVRSEASSIISEVPDYLFGLENSEDLPGPPRESKLKTRPNINDNVSNSDPGYPAPVTSSPYCSTSSGLGPPYMPQIPDLRPVKTKPENQMASVERKQSIVEEVMDTDPTVLQQPGYGSNPMWHYGGGSQYPNPTSQNLPVYYIPNSAPQPGNVMVQQLPIRPQYVQQYSAPQSQIPLGLHQQVPGMGQVYAREMRNVQGMNPYDLRRVPSGVPQQVYYEMGNSGQVPIYPRMAAPGGEEIHQARSESHPGRAV